jgi:hypothetical protein
MGRGLARPLLDAVAAMSRRIQVGRRVARPVPKNLTLYEHFGYGVVGRRVAPSSNLGTVSSDRSPDARAATS